MFLLGGLIGVSAGWQRYLSSPEDIVFTPLGGLPGWRRIAFEGVTGAGGNAANAVFVGIDQTESVDPLPTADLCAELYPSQAPGIPVAIFTDVNCPNCARLEAKLKARRDQLSLNWHDLPLLGPTSENAARAMTAGHLQARGDVFREAVMNAAPGRLMPGVLRRMADDAGLDGTRVLADMDGTVVAAKLKRTRRAASTLGVWGTPGFTIGRTFVLGDMREAVLDQLIAEEATRGGC